MADDEDEFKTPEEEEASETHDSTTTGPSDASPLDRRELFPTTPLATRPTARATARNHRGETPSPRPIDVEGEVQHYLYRTDADRLVMRDVEEEEDEEGEGDSMCDAQEVKDLEEALEESMRDRLQILVNRDEVEEAAIDCETDKFILKKGISPEISLPKVPDDWKPKAVNPEKNQPHWKDIDNPGNWSKYSFRPKFNLRTPCMYKHTALSTGARPLPANAAGDRAMDGWEFNYLGWKADEGTGTNRSGSTETKLFPDDRKGHLDYELLKKLRLSKRRILEGDALFFFQLLLPICDPKKSGVLDDPRMPYYSKVERWSQKYAADIGLMGSYGHEFKPIMLDELVHYDAIMVRDGVHGGADGATYRRWKYDDSAYDPDIAGAMTHTRWLQIKRCIKLCDNDVEPKRGEPGYNPAYKYDYLFKVLINNINELSEKADDDLCGDETTISVNSYGESGCDLIKRVKGKPGVTKGAQIVLVSDVHRNRVRAYFHRHNAHAKIPGVTTQGNLEVRRVMEGILPLVKGELQGRNDTRRQIFVRKPHSTWDNFFSGCRIMNWLGTNGFSATMTCRRDRLPSSIPGMYLHKESTAPGDKAARFGRFNNPITIVKKFLVPPAPVLQEEEEGEPILPAAPITFTRVHVSFQSTSSCNISTVSALNANSVFVVKKERGRGEQKRRWGIEMNQAQQLYLATYGRIDTIDAQIRKCRMYYRSWKYWHAARLHGHALGVVMAYDMYLECTREKKALESFGIDPKEDLLKILPFHEFRDRLSTQGIQYSPIYCKYPGDSQMRVNTKKRKSANGTVRKRGRPRKGEGPVHAVTPEDVKKAKTNKMKSRLCGDLTKITYHLLKKERHHKEHVCKFCGDPCYTRCTICPNKPFLHDFPSKGQCEGRSCFMDYHNDLCFGLAKDDCHMVGVRPSDWSPPTASDRKKNGKQMQDLAEETETEAEE
jgi:hypothetical protein